MNVKELTLMQLIELNIETGLEITIRLWPFYLCFVVVIVFVFYYKGRG